MLDMWDVEYDEFILAAIESKHPIETIKQAQKTPPNTETLYLRKVKKVIGIEIEIREYKEKVKFWGE